jgi:outer membrane protein insertion porin family/translocation and assembly module TamA
VRRRFWRFFGRPSYNLQTATPFAYAGMLDPALQAVIVSFAELYASFDFRDDAVEPHKGVFIGNDFEFAGLGGDARDIKVQPELRGYVPLARRFTLALRASTGFLFPFNYGDTLASNASVGEPPPGVPRADWVRDSQLLYFRAFFSGGPNSNRGYPFRGVGPHGIVPFFAPGISPTELALACDNGDSEFDARCSLPLGGMTLWEASAEARYEISGPFSGATFCDASDVSQDRVDIRLQRPHLSCGVGVRYGTPVGPVRFDIGYRIPGLQVLEDDIPPSEGDPGEIFGIPAALNVSVGEAF